MNKIDPAIQKRQEQIEQLINASAFLKNNWVGQWAAQSYDIYLNQAMTQRIQISEQEIWYFLKKTTGIDLASLRCQRKCEKRYSQF